jgi:hypothetical protein
MGTLHQLRSENFQHRCPKCLVVQDAACSCGVPYELLRPGEAAEKSLAMPERQGWSTRMHAKELGIDNKTVHRAKAPVANATPEKVLGGDGKMYPAGQPKKEKPVIPMPEEGVKEFNKLLDKAMALAYISNDFGWWRNRWPQDLPEDLTDSAVSTFKQIREAFRQMILAID